ncbi:MAG: DnaJ C-terminal domain-containing protein [Acidobacteriota bacterium]
MGWAFARGPSRSPVPPQGKGRRDLGRGAFNFAVPCETCAGTGKKPESLCATCGGEGRVQASETVTVRIPPGVDSGSRVRVPGKGDAGRGGAAGDLYLRIEVAPDGRFTRDGANVTTRVPITIVEAALGAEIDVPTLDGRARIRIPAGSSSGRRVRLGGKGFTDRQSGSRGDLFVEIQIVAPATLSPEARELLEKLQKIAPQNPREESR